MSPTPPPRWKRLLAATEQLLIAPFGLLAVAVIVLLGKVVRPRGIAPDFVLEDQLGRTVRLSDFRGGVVVLEFWATW